MTDSKLSTESISLNGHPNKMGLPFEEPLKVITEQRSRDNTHQRFQRKHTTIELEDLTTKQSPSLHNQRFFTQALSTCKYF